MGKRRISLWIALAFLGLVPGSFRHSVAEQRRVRETGGELKHGRYIGHIELQPSLKKIALVAEFYLEAPPENPAESPALDAMLKLSFGGYNTHEYITEIFKDVRYDFDVGLLTLDSPLNDLVITAEVHKAGSDTLIEGEVFIRSSAVSGKLSLTYETDEPGDEDFPVRNSESGAFLSLLDGQYEGRCENENAVLQIQTVRGLKTNLQTETETSGLSRYYGISARLGFQFSRMCGDLPPGVWCNHYTYGGGSYNPYLRKLELKAPSATDQCRFDNDLLICEIRRSNFSKSCTFKKSSTEFKEIKFFPRLYNLSGSPDQMKALPPAEPPKNTELMKAARGLFAGYLHNETNDTYQYMQLNVIPFLFSENPPHIPLRVVITSTASLYLGKSVGDPFITQRYEPLSFYVVPAFTLAGPTTDSFLNVTEWKQGFIRGVLYSHAFGRVGTVQLVKGVPKSLPATAKAAASFAGEFDGPLQSDGLSSKTRWFRFLFPTQPDALTEHLIRFTGSYTPLIGVTAARNIDRGIYDPFTGKFGWIIQKGEAATFSTGTIDRNNNAQMYWPPAPDIYGVHMNSYISETFGRK